MAISKTKGDLYETYICKYLNETSLAFLWSNIPEKHLLESELVHDLNEHRIKRKKFRDNPNENTNPLIDVGIDILQLDKDGYNLVQCKNGYDKGIRIEDLAGFYMMMMNQTKIYGKIH